MRNGAWLGEVKVSQVEVKVKVSQVKVKVSQVEVKVKVSYVKVKVSQGKEVCQKLMLTLSRLALPL